MTFVNDYENRWTFPDWHSALLWSRARNAQRIKVIMDVLGESAHIDESVSIQMQSYRDLIKAIVNERLFASISIKVSSLGYTLNKENCLQNVLDLAREASSMRVGFEIDMEGRSLVPFTLDTAKACKESGLPVTLAIQAYLDRSEQDLSTLIERGIRVRLVKGAYTGDTNDFMDVQGRFKKLARFLIEKGVSFCVGTHDPDLIVWT